jgi:hypothetical protein
VKYDRQIAAIAKVRRATAIYTDDGGLSNVAGQRGIQAIGIAALVLPTETAQGKLPLEGAPEETNEPTLEEIEQARDAEGSSADPA